jgi:hypothetical protein
MVAELSTPMQETKLAILPRKMILLHIRCTPIAAHRSDFGSMTYAIKFQGLDVTLEKSHSNATPLIEVSKP